MCPFAPLVMRFEPPDILKGTELLECIQKLDKGLSEKAENYSLEKIYLEALPEMKRSSDQLKGLTCFEFVNLCRYYESEAYPIDFSIKNLN